MKKWDIAKKLKEVRENLKLTQAEVAEKIGVKHNTISMWESGKNQPDADTFINLCSIYGVNIDDLFGIESNDESFTSFEQAHIIKYRALDERGKAMVDVILDHEYQRISETEEPYLLAAHHEGEWNQEELDEVKEAVSFVTNLKNK
ncbi:MAG: helix-turn-helix transcriptional regulator [Bacillota bacterium]